MKQSTYVVLVLTILLQSCVPARRFQDAELATQKCTTELEALTMENEKLKLDIDDCNSSKEVIGKSIKHLEQDTTLLGNSLRTMAVQYDRINNLNEQLMDKQSLLMSSRESEKKELLENLMRLQNDLQAQQIALTGLESELNSKSRSLEDREGRVNELEEMLAKKDEAVQALRSKVSDALLNFKDKGLTVIEKDGRVYVSLEAKLLFASGSTSVSKEGTQALVELAKAIQSEKDLSILVEGHTDSDKIMGNSAPYKDNWDLSVMRATSVVRIMMDNSNIDPTQLTAAGKGEFLPVDPADKAKNRRIEIILAPNLDQLFDLINEQ